MQPALLDQSWGLLGANITRDNNSYLRYGNIVDYLLTTFKQFSPPDLV